MDRGRIVACGRVEEIEAARLRCPCGTSKDRLSGGGLRMVLRLLAVVLVFLALLLSRQGWLLLTGSA
jgi:hypothetical protein